MKTRPASLEGSLIWLFFIPICTITLFAVWASISLALDALTSFTLILVVLLPSLFALYKAYQRIFGCLDGVAVQLDGLANEEFTVWHLAKYKQGRVAQIKVDLKTIAERMKNKRQEYLQNETFIFDFINELDLPIVVLDHHYHVYHHNRAAETFYHGKNITGLSTAQLKLEQVQGRWQTLKQNQRFKVVEHSLYRGQRKYQLMVYVSIEQSLRRNEQQAWQKLVRVLNHEVRNSLTPIYSMAQSLKELSDQSNEELRDTMLNVIEKRSEHLLSFVANYSKLSQLPVPQKSHITASGLLLRLQTLFPSVCVKLLSGQNLSLFCDVEQLEQALLNLVKNAQQANEVIGSQRVELTLRLQNEVCQIDVLDNGVGISNTDNLFTPFYSTKEQGNGIGLVLSREIIRAQGGELTLNSRTDADGAVARIELPNELKESGIVLS
ncbi:sensor histidine kinase [Pseudoalteromonas luteoviolacea]|uniref:sensor histidine kinase n=1 Tax=Pseudoalteromonas luteoviolacea TaxID=43657 RepID=UPI001B38ACC7|nr:ATP-binding protein [Pseudoalteromonas luteoviolacea]MBQ4838617.1 sensor histidine kinase [Pseudoalteromonas luteoviolacea]